MSNPHKNAGNGTRTQQGIALIDTSFLGYRAKYGVHHDLSYEGEPTGIIMVFLTQLLLVLREVNWASPVFCFDSRKSYRKMAYPKYKASRAVPDDEMGEVRSFRKQMHRLRTQVLPQMGFRNIWKQSGVESDDLMAKGVQRRSYRKDLICYLVTSDNDMYQCISPQCIMVNPWAKSRDKKWITVHNFPRTFGISPDRWGAVKCLAGCPGDGVKGIPGIGEKTAIKYLEGTLDPRSIAYNNITSSAGYILANQNMPLVILPHERTKEVTFRQDELSVDRIRIALLKLGMKNTWEQRQRDWRRLVMGSENVC